MGVYHARRVPLTLHACVHTPWKDMGVDLGPGLIWDKLGSME